MPGQCPGRVVVLRNVGQRSASVHLPMVLDPNGEGSFVFAKRLDVSAHFPLMLDK